MRSATLAVLGSLLTALTFAAVLIAIDQAPSSPVSDDRAVEPVAVTPVVAESRLAEAVSLGLEWTDESSLLWPGAAGTVTGVQVGPGDRVVNGTVVASVDRIGVVALTTDSPLYRDLGPGSRGPDVADLAGALADLGLLKPADIDDRYGPAITSAVRELNRPRGASSPRLPVSHVIWLPATFEVGRSELTLGGPAPPPGEGVLYSERHIASARVVGSGVDPATAGRPLSFTDGLDREVVLGESVFAIDADGYLRAPAGMESAVEVGAESVDQAVVRLTVPLRRVRVPASAILTDASGAVCVVTPQGRTVSVEVLEGSAGSAFVSGAPEGPIVANPVRSGLATSCS
ncbi:MAG TPA: hypothetical protein ENI86_04575 [Acidimicrobiales bacterium]|nr:hypothetical protein [Acidimicrobiales bacterium]